MKFRTAILTILSAALFTISVASFSFSQSDGLPGYTSTAKNLTISNFPVDHEYYVDASRSATYVADGSQPRPYLTVKAAVDAINTDATAHAAAGHYELSNYVVHILPGTYSDNLTFNNEKYIRLEGMGVTLSGTIALTQTQQTADYYSRIEFVGMEGYRAEKGPAFKISGAITATRNNDSLTYVTFKGIWLTGAYTAIGDGTWVTQFYNSRVDGTIDANTLTTADACILLEADGTNFNNTIQNEVSLYNVNNSSFKNLTLTPWYENTIKDSTFSGTISIIPQGGGSSAVTYLDGTSYQSLASRTPTLTGVTTTLLEKDYVLVNHDYYVDASRGTHYTADGTYLSPYATVLAAVTAINTDATAHAAAGHYELTNYVIHVAAGTYSDALVFNNEKNIKIVGTGVTLSGTIALTQTQQSGDYYSRIEFSGIDGFRAEKGPGMTISGAISATRNNDSLTYVTFKGVYLTSGGTFTATGDGTWVVQFFNSRVSSVIDGNTFTDPDSTILVESDWTEFAGVIQNEVSLYNCTNTEFWGAINTTPWYSSTFKDSGFHAAVSIIPQTGAAESTLYVDPVSYKSLAARNPTLTGATLVETGTFDTLVANSASFPLVADAVIQYGSTVMPDAGTDGRFDVTTGSATLSIGVLQGVGPSAQGTTYNVVYGGLARLLPTEDSAVTRGHYLIQSATAGRVDDSATVTTIGLNIAKALYSEAVSATINPAGCTGGSGCINTALDTPSAGPAGQITLGVDVAALGWAVGQPVVYYNSGGTTPTGLTDGNVYWLKSVSTTKVTIAATKTGAVVVPSDQGDDGTQYLQRLPLAVVSIQ